MTTPLSPATQKVKDAAIDAWGDPRSTVQGIAVAALRAAVEQTIQPDPIMGTDSIIYAKHLFAIVTELEADL